MATKLPKAGQKISVPLRPDTAECDDIIVEAIVQAITPEGLLVRGRVNRMMTFLVPTNTHFTVVKNDD